MSTSNDQYNDTMQQLLNLQNLNKILLVKCEQKDYQLKDQEEFIKEMQIDLIEKNAAISKASKVIESLRNELEKSSKDLKFIEEENEKNLIEKKKFEKEVIELQREIEMYKKSESSGKFPLKKNTEKFESISASSSAILIDQDPKDYEILMKKVNELTTENLKLQKHNDDLTLQIIELNKRKDIMINKEHNQLQQQQHTSQCDDMQKIQQIKDENIEFKKKINELQKKIEFINANNEKELKLIKKEAENNIRLCQNSIPNFSHVFDTLSKENSLTVTPISKSRKEIAELFTNRGKDHSPYKDTSLNSSQIDSKYFSSTTTLTTNKKPNGKSGTKNEISVKRRFENLKSIKASPQNLDKNAVSMFDPVEILETEPDKKGVFSFNVEFMKIALADSLDREHKFVDHVEKAIYKEVQLITKFTDTVMSKSIELRPEIEGWMMRNEELEQKLYEAREKLLTMQMLLSQYESTLRLHEEQRAIEKGLYTNLLNEYETIFGMIQVEVKEKNKIIQDNYIDNERMFGNTMMNYDMKLKEIKIFMENFWKRYRKSEQEKHDIHTHFKELKKRNDELVLCYQQLRNNYIYIENMLGFTINNTTTNQEYTTGSYNVPLGIESIIKKVNSLLNTEQKYHILYEESTRERNKFTRDIAMLENQLKEITIQRNTFELEKNHYCELWIQLEKNYDELMRSSDEYNKPSNNNNEKDLQRRILKDIDNYETKIKDLNTHILNLQLEQERLIRDKEERIKYMTLTLEDKENNNIKLIEKIQYLETEANQLQILLEKALRDYESAQIELQSKSKIIKLLEACGQGVKVEYDKFKRDYEEAAYMAKEIKGQVHGMASESKIESIKILETQLSDLRTSEENLRNELNSVKKEAKNDMIELKREIMNLQAKANLNQERIKQYEIAVKEWDRREQNYKQQIEELTQNYNHNHTQNPKHYPTTSFDKGLGLSLGLATTTGNNNINNPKKEIYPSKTTTTATTATLVTALDMNIPLNTNTSNVPILVDTNTNNGISNGNVNLKHNIEMLIDKEGNMNNKLIDKLKKNIKEYYRKKLDDYNTLINYIKRSLIRLYDNQDVLTETDLILDLSSLQNQNKSLTDMKINEHYNILKGLLVGILNKRDMNIQADNQFIKGICEIFMTRLNLTNEECKLLEEMKIGLNTGQSQANNNDFNGNSGGNNNNNNGVNIVKNNGTNDLIKMQKYKNILLNVISNPKSWEKSKFTQTHNANNHTTNVLYSNNNTTNLANKNEKSSNHTGNNNELVLCRLSDINNILIDYFTILNEKSSKFKIIYDTFQSIKDNFNLNHGGNTTLHKHSSSSASKNPSNNHIINPINPNINDDNQYESITAILIPTTAITLLHTLDKNFINIQKELSSQSQAIAYLRDHVKNGLTTRNDNKHLNTEFMEYIRDDMKKSMNNHGLKENFKPSGKKNSCHVTPKKHEVYNDNAKEIIDEGFVFLKELFSEMQSVTKTIIQNTNKLDDKLFKNPKLADLIEDSKTICTVLEENINKNNKVFLDYLKKDLEEYQKFLNAFQSIDKAVLDMLYNKKASLHCVEKICEESLNIKNTINLLDLNLTLDAFQKGKDIGYDYIKKKLNENNTAIESVIKTSEKILNYSDTINIDSKGLIIEPKVLYGKVMETHNNNNLNGHTIPERVFHKKTNIRLQLYELIKENAGFRMGLNSLIYILYKYQIIIQDIEYHSKPINGIR